VRGSRLRGCASIAVAVCSLGSATATTASPTTAIHYFVAFEHGKIAPRLRVTARVTGRCDDGWEIEGRPFVWRCVWGNVLADPCFSASATGKVAVCPARPWSLDVVVVRAVPRLHGWKGRRPEIDAAFPWGVWTAGGKRCTAIRTGTSRLDGMRVNHGCNDGGVLVGPVDRRAEPWTILYARSVGNAPHPRLRRVRITDAWW
jgi:hypothetical protein